MRCLKDHILHLFLRTFVRGYGYDPMALPLKCREAAEASQCGTLNVEFHVEPAAPSNPLVRSDFFCCVFHVCLVQGFFFPPSKLIVSMVRYCREMS